MNKNVELENLKQEMLADKTLPLKPANLVFGEGNIDCHVMFVGEAPGEAEDRLIRPFVGRSGKLLDQLLAEISWQREQVYITNIVKRRPPENRDPSPEEIAVYKPYLAKQIEIIKPKIIATLGRFSMNYFLPLAKITRDQGKLLEVNGQKIFPLFHPAAVLRGTVAMKDYQQSFKRLASALNNPADNFGPF